MKDIAIFGAGGFGREIACLIRIINEIEVKWNFIGFFDESKKKGSGNEYGNVLGGLNELNSWGTPLSLVIAIGNPESVKHIVDNVSNPYVDFPNIVAPNTIYLDKNNIEIGHGNIIGFSCLLSCNVKIGNFNILNGNVTIGHDANIGNFNSLMPGVKISGEVTIGDENFIGVGAVVLQHIKIGCHTRIGANGLIIRKTKDGVTYVTPPSDIF